MIIVLTTVATASDALKLARLVVTEKLAACVNIVKLEKSVYFWKGRMRESGEYLLLIKTGKPKYARLERFIKANHSYELPEVVSIKVDRGNREYLSWAMRGGI